MEELKELLNEIKLNNQTGTEFRNRVEDKLQSILVQTTKTNGRMDRAEIAIEKQAVEFSKQKEYVDKLQNSNSYTNGKNKIIWIVLSVGGTLLAIVLEKYISTLFK